MADYTYLCKIANLGETVESIKYNGKQWQPTIKESSQVIDFCENYKRTGFSIVEDKDALYIVYRQQLRNSCDDLFAQSTLFPMIITDYIPDLSVAVRVQEIHQHQPLKLIKKYVALKFFESLHAAHNLHQETPEKAEVPLNLPSNFLPTLCCYQERSVRWLLNRERSRTYMHSCYKSLKAKDGEIEIFKSTLSTHFLQQKPPDVLLAPGGILADEMGLGKTVEMIALMLLNKREEQQFHPPVAFDRVDSDDEYEVPLKKLYMEKKMLCICASNKQRNKLIECSICHVFQHVGCVTKFNFQHDEHVNEPYLCPNCWKNYTNNLLVESGATLIVTPNTIKNQWLNELRRHISSGVRIHVYDGIASSGGWISPRQLADYDLVLTDYAVLRREVFHTSTHDSDRVMRHKPRSMRLYTPLLMLNWWRVCLDEAQMVESDTSQMAALVRTLPAVNRWAVTGTPIQRSIDDLYPLVRFIGLEETLDAASWETLLKDFMLHYDAGDDVDKCASLLLVQVFRQIMWRTCKQQVLHELPIPPQTEQVHRITLSNLERLFYTEQHEECEQMFNEALSKYIERTDLVLSTSQQIIKIVMQPLLKIRQCCTISVVSGNRAATGMQQKQFLQPKELHAHLKLSNEKECKSELRSMASSHNGCAAIHFMQEQYTEAVNSYELVLKLARDYEGEENMSVDSLLQIHALYNILEARNISPVLAKQMTPESVQQYETQLNKLEWKYLETYASQLYVVQTTFQQARETLTTNLSNIQNELIDFVADVLFVDEDSNLQTQLLAKILDECSRKFGSMRLEAAYSLRGVMLMIATWYSKLMKEHKRIETALTELEFYTTNVKPRSQVSVECWRNINNFISSVYDCHLLELRNMKNHSDDEDEDVETTHTIKRKQRQQQQNKNFCKLCKLRDMLNNYECLLFKKVFQETTNALEGDENPQLEIEMIRVIFSFFKPKRPASAAEMEKHLLALQSMQILCKKAIKYWIEIEYTVKAFDELDMCKMRITLTEDEEERSNFKIMRYELSDVYRKQQENLYEAQRAFAAKLARLKYIKHLEAKGVLEPCPICQTDSELRHIVLDCGHHMCIACFKDLRRYCPGQRLSCSVCRHQQNTNKVYYVDYMSNAGTHGNGDFSSKIAYILRLVLKLQSENTDVPLKILIFSHWQPILQAVADAFSYNNIRFVIYSTARTIENFKNLDSGITCLLMPLSKGSKGINLIEATHVFLVEPILNPSEEQQAIGRVHRFGQTRPTTVHRFIVDGTIEENIYDFVTTTREARHEYETMTFHDLRKLFKLRVSAELDNSTS